MKFLEHNEHGAPTVGECDECGADVYLIGPTCECGKCGAVYNCFGQRLSDPSNWGEETGEYESDIYNGGDE